MDPADIELRNATYRRFIELGRAPTATEIAEATGARGENVAAAWHRLHDAHALVLDERGEIRMANPFSAVPTAFRVHADGREWFANCAWDAFGIGAALHVDCRIESSSADCGEPITIDVRDGTPDDTDLLFHVLVPAVSWWQDIGFT
jgi:hypothetical protein